MREIELLLILGLYYFDKGKNIESFTIRFNQYFKKDVSAQTILFAIAKFRNIDPVNNTNIQSNEYKAIWDEYIGKDRISELKEVYKSFKKGMYVSQNDVFGDMPEENKVFLKNPHSVIINDAPQVKPDDYAIRGIKAYRRSQEVVANSLALANYKCEAKCSTELFLRKDGKSTYTEAHHIIPLCYQDEFDYSLDVEANVISLCPNCHCKLHYGYGTESMLRAIYEERKKRLKACGLDISFEKLLLLYR